MPINAHLKAFTFQTFLVYLKNILAIKINFRLVYLFIQQFIFFKGKTEVLRKMKMQMLNRKVI